MYLSGFELKVQYEISFPDKQNGVGDAAARAGFVAAGPEGGGATGVKVKGAFHTQRFKDVGDFSNSGALDDADIGSGAFIGDETAGAARALFGITATAEGDVAAG